MSTGVNISQKTDIFILKPKSRNPALWCWYAVKEGWSENPGSLMFYSYNLYWYKPEEVKGWYQYLDE